MSLFTTVHLSLAMVAGFVYKINIQFCRGIGRRSDVRDGGVVCEEVSFSLRNFCDALYGRCGQGKIE